MSSFYKMDPAAWDFGTANLTLEEEAAYLRIVNAIHKHDAPVPDNDRVLAGLFRSSTRKARALIDALVAAGKVTIEDGKIWNDRARSDLVQRQFASISRAESGAKGGRTRAERAAKSLKENETHQASASSRIEENRIDKSSVSKDTGAAAPTDPAKVAFDAGVKVLSAAGKSPSAARSIVGKWRGQHGDEAVIAALGKAQREGAVDPVAFCEGIFRQSAKSNGKAARRQLPDGRWQSYDQFNGWVNEHV
jgi:uncharacterized protein YdaU (DUF1376 family)